MFKKQVLKSSIFVFTALAQGLYCGANCYAAPARGDFDGDGSSDLSIVSVDRKAKTTTWTVHPGSGLAEFSYSFNLPGDALITGKFYQGDTRVYPGLFYVESAQNPLVLRIKSATGEQNLRYGLPGDQITNFGDVDCDGVTDLITTRAGSSNHFPGYRLWYIALSGSGGGIIERVFGFATDRIGVADVDGDGCDELVALRGGTYEWFAMRALSTEFLTTVQWGLPGDIPLLPQDMNGDGSPDYIVSRRIGDSQFAFVRYNDSSSDVFVLGLRNSIPLVGNFSGEGNSFGWHQRDSGLFGLLTASGWVNVFAWGNSTTAIVRPDGTVVQPKDDGVFGSNTPPPPPPGDGGFSGGSIESLHCDRYLDLPDGRGGSKYRPTSSRHKRKFIWHSSLYGQLVESVSFTPEGERIGEWKIFFNSPEGGPRDRQYLGGSGVPGEIIEGLLRSGETVCVVISDPRRVID